MFEWLCDKTGINKLWSTTQVWKCNLDYSDIVANFEEDAGLHRLMIDHINDEDMSAFILAWPSAWPSGTSAPSAAITLSYASDTRCHAIAVLRRAASSRPCCLSGWSIVAASLYFLRTSATDVLCVPRASASLPERSTREVNASMASVSGNPAGRRGGGIGPW